MNHHSKPPECARDFCCTKIINFGASYSAYEALKNVNLHIHCGELTAIVGPNGAGKSTFLKALLGEIPHTGQIEYLDEKENHAARPLMGYVPQKLELDTTSPVSVFDLFAAALYRRPMWLFQTGKMREKVLASLDRAGASHLLGRRLGELSGGELQRVLLALALQPPPDLLLLDEPVSGIDHAGLRLFYKTVSDLRRQYDLSIILVSHDPDLVAQYADRVVFMNNKTVECCGTPQEVFANEKVAELFGPRIQRQSAERQDP